MENLIREYVDKLSEDDIKKFALKKGININSEDTRVLYMYVKNYWQVFLKGDSTELFNELKEKLSPEVYDIAYNLYKEYKNKIN